MNILCDKAMPYASSFFRSLGDVKLFSVGDLSEDLLAKTNVLLVRSTTKVGNDILSKAPNLKFVGTATAGFDHLDVGALTDAGITTAVASGCNAVSVAQYTLSAFFELALRDDFDLFSKKIAVVGAGHVGSTLAHFLNVLEIDHCLYDPPLQSTCDGRKYVDFDTVMECDVITLHTPLTNNGQYPTRYMFAYEQLSQLRYDQYLINAGRGEVVNNSDLLNLFEQGKRLNVVLDVWENEPGINRNLIPFLRLSTAHIAGHSLEGKARGTQFLYDQLCTFLGAPIVRELNEFLPITDTKIEGNAKDPHLVVNSCLQAYDISHDDSVFRTLMAQSSRFAEIRKSYPVRREYSALTVNLKQSNTNNKSIEILKKLGFNVTC